MKALLLVIIVFFSVPGKACKPTGPKDMNLSVDIKKGTRTFYTQRRLLTERPSLSLTDCRDTAQANKYVMVGLGLQNIILSNDNIGYSYIPQEESLNCKIANNPFSKIESKEDRYKKLLAKRDFFNRCVVVDVTELNSNIELKYPAHQPGCKLTKKSKWSVSFEGAYCYFSPSETSNISIHLDVKEECRGEKTLSQIKTNLTDYAAVLNTYIAGDASGFSTDLTAVSTTDVRLSYNPVSELINVSDDYGKNRPTWPTKWQAADLYLGKLRVSSLSSNYDELQLPLVANTICKRKCNGNICTSACDYSQPIIGEFSLYQLENGKRDFLKFWYDGSVVPPQYQGLLHGLGVTLPKNVLKEGVTYEIEALFKEPDTDFAFFSGRVARELRFEKNYIGPFIQGGQINSISKINTITHLEDVPTVPVINGINFEEPTLNALSRALMTWQSKLNNSFWPPYYDEICSVNGSCQKVGTGFVQLKIQFQLTKNNRGFVVNLINGQRKSNIVSDVVWNADKVPSVNCGLKSQDDDDFYFDDIL